MLVCPHQQQQRQLLYSLCRDKRKKVTIKEDKTLNLDLMSTTKEEKMHTNRAICSLAHSGNKTVLWHTVPFLENNLNNLSDSKTP